MIAPLERIFRQASELGALYLTEPEADTLAELLTSGRFPPAIVHNEQLIYLNCLPVHVLPPLETSTP